MRQKFFFEEWQDLIVSKGTNEWQAKFYDDYKGEIIIHQLDRQDRKLYTVKVHEAYPKTINAQDFSLGSNDAYQTVGVEFAYRWWERMAVSEIKTTVTTVTPESGSGIGPPGRNYPPTITTGADGASAGEAGGTTGTGTIPGTAARQLNPS